MFGRPPFPQNAVVIGYRIPKPVRRFTAIGAAAMVFILVCGFAFIGNYRDTLGVTATLGGFLVLLHLQQFRYRVAYDEDRLYVRRWGILNGLGLKSQITSVPWSKIRGVETSVSQVFGRDWDYEPNEFLEVRYGRKRTDRVRLYPYMMNMNGFEEFCRVLSATSGHTVEDR